MKNVIPFFKKVIQNNKLAHLYILTGDEGSPLEATSLLISYYVIANLKDIPNLKKQILSIVYPNLYIIDKPGSILKEDIITLQEEFTKTSIYDTKRVFIINHFDSITQQAANMLLKFLEEPINVNTVGFLLTDNIDKVLKTIVSRAQVINIPTPSKAELLKELEPLETSQIVKEVLVSLTSNIDLANKLYENSYFNQALAIAKSIYCDIAMKKPIVTKYYKEALSAGFKEVYKYLTEIIFLLFLDLVRNKEQKYNFQSLNNYTNLIKDNINPDKLYELCTIGSDYFKKNPLNLNLNLEYLNYLISLERIYL